MFLPEIRNNLLGLVVFRDILKDKVVQNLLDMVTLPKGSPQESLCSVAEFTASLFESTVCWSDYLENLVLECETICITKGRLEGPLAQCLANELAFLEELGQWTLGDYSKGMPQATSSLLLRMPPWAIRPCPLRQNYYTRMEQVSQKGYGIYAKYHVFTVENGTIIPVNHPDPQRLEQLPGYEAERQKLVNNTKALLEGRPTNNVLLYGDAGTGKSSAVKAIVNEFADSGLRLIEMKKNQLYQLPKLVEQLAPNPLKFIIFIDDLSFSSGDDNFSALKAILEGSVCGLANNTVVYATSNRRHLVKETHSERQGDDIHQSDTRQELLSLSARFGLTITFSSPEKKRYCEIVLSLASQYDLEVDDEETLLRQAEAFALRSGGRSPRTAKQFIRLKKAEV